MNGTGGFAPPVPGLTKTVAPLGGQDLFQSLVGKLTGKPQAPKMSAGDKVAQAIQLLREAAQEDLRIAPLISKPLQDLVTGGSPGGLGPVGPAPMGAGPMAGPVPMQHMAAMAGLPGMSA